MGRAALELAQQAGIEGAARIGLEIGIVTYLRADFKSVEIDEAGLWAVGHGLPVMRAGAAGPQVERRSGEHTSALQSLMPISYAALCLIKNTQSSYTNK